MGFLQDFGLDDIIKDFAKEVIMVDKELNDFKKEVISSFTDISTDVTSTLDDTKKEIANSRGMAMDIIKRSTDLNS